MAILMVDYGGIKKIILKHENTKFSTHICTLYYVVEGIRRWKPIAPGCPNILTFRGVRPTIGPWPNWGAKPLVFPTFDHRFLAVQKTSRKFTAMNSGKSWKIQEESWIKAPEIRGCQVRFSYNMQCPEFFGVKRMWWPATETRLEFCSLLKQQNHPPTRYLSGPVSWKHLWLRASLLPNVWYKGSKSHMYMNKLSVLCFQARVWNTSLCF